MGIFHFSHRPNEQASEAITCRTKVTKDKVIQNTADQHFYMRMKSINKFAENWVTCQKFASFWAKTLCSTKMGIFYFPHQQNEQASQAKTFYPVTCRAKVTRFNKKFGSISKTNDYQIAMN
jgi:hypothetical protein